MPDITTVLEEKIKSQGNLINTLRRLSETRKEHIDILSKMIESLEKAILSNDSNKNELHKIIHQYETMIDELTKKIHETSETIGR